MVMLARALYDNVAETEDELSFKIDQIIEVIQKDADQMEGWWKCRLDDKENISQNERQGSLLTPEKNY